MKCPYCLKDMVINSTCRLNVNSYHKTAFIATPCCHRMIAVSPVEAVRVSAVVSSRVEDDWGVETIPTTASDIKINEHQVG